LRAADAIVAPSEAFLNDVVEIFPSLRGKLICVHNVFV
jgi:hypothetical protein